MFSSFLERWAVRLVIIGTHVVIALLTCFGVIWWMAHGTIYHRVKDVPKREAGLVLGCVKMIGTRENTFFIERVNAAVELFAAGKVRYLIVSGDNHNRGYDEPTDLKAALVEQGVPADRIYCDYAGFRTLDSVVRAKKIFMQDDFTIISQKFHNERALYIAHRKGLPDVIAFNARDSSGEGMMKMYLRELFARVKAVIDVEMLGSKPKFLGDRIPMGEKTPPVDAKPLRVKSGEAVQPTPSP
jgi:SanA protein